MTEMTPCNETYTHFALHKHIQQTLKDTEHVLLSSLAPLL